MGSSKWTLHFQPNERPNGRTIFFEMEPAFQWWLHLPDAMGAPLQKRIRPLVMYYIFYDNKLKLNAFEKNTILFVIMRITYETD